MLAMLELMMLLAQLDFAVSVTLAEMTTALLPPLVTLATLATTAMKLPLSASLGDCGLENVAHLTRGPFAANGS